MCPRGVITSRSNSGKERTTPQLWLLLVGVNQYQDIQLPSLRYSAVDCQVLAAALMGATGEQFPLKEVKIYHDFADEKPLLATVRASLQQIAADARPIDTVLFYFSGHGMLQSSTQQAFLCLQDTQKDNLEITGLAVKDLLELLGKCGAQNQVVWLDACHSGGMSLRGASELNLTPQLVEVLQRGAGKGKGFYALLSCDINQQSWEFPELGHGVFTYYLMRGLQGEAADAEGVIFADGLYRYVYHQTLQYIDKTNQQLRLINQQKRGKGDSQLFSEYPLQTPKRIVEGVGELILGSIPVVANSRSPRIALVIEGLGGGQVSLDFSKVLVGAGAFELEYLPRPGRSTAEDIRQAIQDCLAVPIKQQFLGEESATVLLYLRGRLEETPTGEAALLISDDIWLSRSWLRQQLRRSQVTQQIIIFDCPIFDSTVSSLKDWVEDLQLDSQKGLCIIAATSPKDNRDFFTQALIDTLNGASVSAGLSVAGWITQLQVQLAGIFHVHFWLSGTQGVIEIMPAISGANIHKKAAGFDLRICPYPGLRSFGEADAQYFYGRESLTQQLISQVAHQSFLALVGASGSGKSSVVKAGLIAQLRPGKLLPGSESWLIKSLRPGGRPIDELVRCLGEGVRGDDSSLVFEAMLYQGVEGFVYWLRSRTEPMVVLVVDQFEELFTLSPAEERGRFLDLLLGAMVYAPDKFKLVITLRADFIASCLEVPGLALLLQQSSVLVSPSLTDNDYRRVIVNPAQQVGLNVDPELVEVLVQELNHSAGDLPLLEFVLEQLWEFRQGGELTLAAYQQQIGGIKGALERKAEAVYASLDGQAQDCARWIFLSLTQLGEGTEDTRRRIFKSDLVVQKYPAALVERTLQALTAAKLVVVNLDEEVGSRGVRSEELGVRSYDSPHHPILLYERLRQRLRSVQVSPSPKAVTIEVAHEILIRHWSTLRWWLEENRSRLRSQRQIEQSAALWKYNNQQADFLLHGVRLAEAEEIYVKYTEELSQDVQGFIAACLDARLQQQFEQKKRLRQAQRAVAVISVLGVAAAGFGGFAYLQKQAAQLREISALNASAEALLLSHQQLEAIIASVKAGREVKQVFAPQSDVQFATVATFQQAVYQSHEFNRLSGHAQQVNAISFSPDGKFLASASDDQTIKLWGRDGELIRTIRGNNRVTAIAFSPTGLLVAASGDKIWIISRKGAEAQREEGTGEFRSKVFGGHTDKVTDVAFSGDGKLVVSAGLDKTIKLWRIDGSLIRSWIAHDGWVNSVCFSPDGNFISSGGEDNLVRVWRSDNGRLINSLSGHEGRVTRIQFSQDGKFIASAGGDKTIKLWNVEGKLLQTLVGHGEQVNSIKFSPDNQILASASADRTIKFWRLDGKLLATLQGHGEQVRDISFSPDGKFLASASADKSIRLWNVPSQNSKSDDVYGVSFRPDGKMFASAGWDGTVKLSQGANLAKTEIFKAHQDIIDAVSFSPNGKMLATASADKSIKIWESQNHKLIKVLTGQEKVTSISFSPDGKMIAAGGADKIISLWRLSDGRLLQTLKGHADEVTSVSFSPDGQMLASGSVDNTVKLWGVNGGLVRSINAHGLAIASVMFSQDGQTLVTASWDNSIKLWQVATGSLINTLTGHTDGVTSLSLSPDGQILASGSADNSIKLWNLADGTLLKTLWGYPSKVNSVSFSPDGKVLLSGGKDAGVMLWNLDLDDLLRQGCGRIAAYLKNNPNVSQGDRNICD
ncbi:MAG: nSTAND1 domain-containing NTPase [Gloeotrichia echinulata DVL01]